MKWSYYKIKTEAILKAVDVSVIDFIAEGLDCPQEDIEYVEEREE